MPLPLPKVKQVSRTASSSKLIRTSQTNKGVSKSHVAGRADGADGGNGDDHDQPWLRTSTSIVPIDQLRLTGDELREEITRVLSTTDRQAFQNLSEFSFKERSFVPVEEDGEQLIVKIDIQGGLLHKDCEEAREQMAKKGSMSIPGKGKKEYDDEEKRESVDSGEAVEKEDAEEEAAVEDEEEGGGEDGEGGDENADEDRKDSNVDPSEMQMGNKKATNQFNCCERAALTYNNPSRNLETQTYPPPRAIFSAQVLQWTIYDAYLEDNAKQQKLAEKEREKKDVKVGATTKKEEGRRKGRTEPDAGTKMLLAVKTLERMINQNTFDDIAQDYRYWEDPSDDYREEEGTLLPLWKFVFEKTKKNSVTSVCWNPCYFDLFAVSFGGFDFMGEQPGGAVCLFTLKNPTHPEFICHCDSGVVCVDIHPKYPSLLVVGLYDGNVAVYNARAHAGGAHAGGAHAGGAQAGGAHAGGAHAGGAHAPQFRSNAVDNKHAGIVWQVKWGADLPDGEVNFFSVSADGCVYNWVLMQSELSRTVVIPLFIPSESLAGPDGDCIQLTGCGTTIAFHPTEALIFLVGTEEGLIYKCSTAYSSMYLAAYEAHHMPVHKIDYNKYNPGIFLSCGADWRIKIWEDQRSEPLFEFDLASPVGDVEWAPYSSTVFAGVTADGKVHIFDLHVNKYKAICVQSVVSKKQNKLTRIAFNHKLPIIIVGDDRGCISSLKLSPNLRRKVKPLKKGPTYTLRELEVQKLEKLLALVREPVTQPPSPENGSIPST